MTAALCISQTLHCQSSLAYLVSPASVMVPRKQLLVYLSIVALRLFFELIFVFAQFPKGFVCALSTVPIIFKCHVVFFFVRSCQNEPVGCAPGRCGCRLCQPVPTPEPSRQLQSVLVLRERLTAKSRERWSLWCYGRVRSLLCCVHRFIAESHQNGLRMEVAELKFVSCVLRILRLCSSCECFLTGLCMCLCKRVAVNSA